MTIRYSAFILPHVGEEYSTCADRFNYSEDHKSFAIADGVGNSLYPEHWATLVCEDYVSSPNVFLLENTLLRQQQLISDWQMKRDQIVANLSDMDRFIYEEGLNKADFAACTFVGLSFGEKEWKCHAIGDSYLFVLNKDLQISDKVASMDGIEFGNSPEYFASKQGYDYGKIVQKSGNFENISYFLLMTDALSDWFLSATDEKRKKLLEIKTHEEFEKFVEEERQARAMKDDDTTLLMLKIESEESESLSFVKENVDDINGLIASEQELTERPKEKEEQKDGEVVVIEKNSDSDDEALIEDQAPIDQNDFSTIIEFLEEFCEKSPKWFQHILIPIIKKLKQYLNGTSNERPNM